VGYNLKKDKIFVGNQYRIFFKHKNIANYFCSFLYPIAIFVGFFITFTIVAPALASETNKFSALLKEEMRGDLSLTQVKTSPHNKVSSYCLSLLQKNTLSNNKEKWANQNKPFKSLALHGRNRAPVALSLYLGVRRALGPTEGTVHKINDRRFVQNSSGSQFGAALSPRALAIAAYRACEKEQSLKNRVPSHY